MNAVFDRWFDQAGDSVVFDRWFDQGGDGVIFDRWFDQAVIGTWNGQIVAVIVSIHVCI